MMVGARHHRSVARKTAWAVIGAGALALLVTVSFVRETLRSRQIDREISDLKTESEQLRARNLEMVSLNTSTGRGEFLEREARLKLNLRKEGEHVVVLQKETPPSRRTSLDVDAELTALSIPRRWWLYFTDHPAFAAYAAETGGK